MEVGLPERGMIPRQSFREEVRTLVRSEVDEAFEWLVVILGVVTAILIQYPEYFYTTTPGETAAALKAALAVIPPIVIAVIIWLVGKLSERDTVQAVAKIAAWILVLNITYMNLYSYFLGIVWSVWGTVPGGLLVAGGFVGLFALAPSVSHFVLIPRYRRTYPGAALFQGRWRLGLLYVCTYVVLALAWTLVNVVAVG